MTNGGNFCFIHAVNTAIHHGKPRIILELGTVPDQKIPIKIIEWTGRLAVFLADFIMTISALV